MIREIRQTVFFQQSRNFSMAVLEAAEFFFRKTQRIDDFFLFPFVIGFNGFLQVMSHTHIIDHKALVFCVAADPVYPGDGLEKIVAGDDLVQIHDLFDGRVKAGNEHVVDDEDTHISGNAFILAAKTQFETLDAARVP